MTYCFFDTDASGNAEYDITGEEYKTLLEHCCRYSSVFSLYQDNIEAIRALEPYRIVVDDKVFHREVHYGHYGNTEGKVIYYRVCEEIYDILTKHCNSLFQWINGWGYHNPTDPIFYREDGSVFLFTRIHEGVAALIPRKNEDVSNIIKNPLWIPE